MTTINAVPKPVVDKISDELIVKNFELLTRGFEAVEEWMYLVEGRLGKLERLGEKAAQVSKKGVGPGKVLLCCAISVAIAPQIRSGIKRGFLKLEKVVNEKADEKRSASYTMSQADSSEVRFTPPPSN